MGKIKRFAPILALVLTGALVAACDDNKDGMNQLSSQVKAVKGEIASATKGIQDKMNAAMLKLGSKIGGKADKAAVASAQKSMSAMISKVQAEVGSISKNAMETAKKAAAEHDAMAKKFNGALKAMGKKLAIAQKSAVETADLKKLLAALMKRLEAAEAKLKAAGSQNQ